MPRVTVVGSVNVDLVASCPRLPGPGETVTGATLTRAPGGKGANQALAARRLGAEVRLVARVGDDHLAAVALGALRAEGVDLAGCLETAGEPTGVALILVGPDGENVIAVVSGANARLVAADVDLTATDAVLCQLEIPVDAVAAAAEQTRGLFCVNLAPALALPDRVLARADLVVANEPEAAALGAALDRLPLVALTRGARGASLVEHGVEVASAPAPPVEVVDAVGAGDAFCAALVVSLVEGRPREQALARACAAGALATTRPGAQASLPTARELDALIDRIGSSR